MMLTFTTYQNPHRNILIIWLGAACEGYIEQPTGQSATLHLRHNAPGWLRSVRDAGRYESLDAARLATQVAYAGHPGPD